MFNKLYNVFDDLGYNLYNCLISVLKRPPFYEKIPYNKKFLKENFKLLSQYLPEYPEDSTVNISSSEESDRYREAHELKKELVEWWEEERPLKYEALEELKAKQDQTNPDTNLRDLIEQKERELEQLDYIQLSKLISLYPYFDQSFEVISINIGGES